MTTPVVAVSRRAPRARRAPGTAARAWRGRAGAGAGPRRRRCTVVTPWRSRIAGEALDEAGALVVRQRADDAERPKRGECAAAAASAARMSASGSTRRRRGPAGSSARASLPVPAPRPSPRAPGRSPSSATRRSTGAGGYSGRPRSWTAATSAKPATSAWSGSGAVSGAATGARAARAWNAPGRHHPRPPRRQPPRACHRR